MVNMVARTWIRRLALWIAVIAIVLIVSVPLSVAYEMAPFVARKPQRLPSAATALVLGAGVRRSGELSPILEERVLGGVELYFQGKVDQILMSGDGQSTTNNEVAAMRRYALEYGVPDEAIFLDPMGLSTFESCMQVRGTVPLQDVIVVTQGFHISRALYICRSLGINAHGYAVGSWKRYAILRSPYALREWLATYKAAWELSHAPYREN